MIKQFTVNRSCLHQIGVCDILPKAQALVKTAVFSYPLTFLCRYTDTETKGTKVFTYKLLMRSKLSPDSSKLVVSTQNGYIIVIHDLDLLTLADDLKNFPPYGSPSSFPFQRNQRRNRVELIREWPSGDNASDIASLQVVSLSFTGTESLHISICAGKVIAFLHTVIITTCITGTKS